MTSIFVLGVMAFSSSSKSMVHSAADEVLVLPSLGGCIGTKTIFPPGISMLLIYLERASDTVAKDALREGTSSLVEEWLEDNDFFARLNECHERAQHAFL